MLATSLSHCGLRPLGRRLARTSGPRSQRPLAVVPRAQLEDAAFNHVDLAIASLSASIFSLAEAAPDAAAAVDAAVEATNKNDGFMGALTGGFETFLKFLDQGLVAAHVPYSYGFSIMLLTLLVKLATWPLTSRQVESSLSIQALQPRIQELRRIYGNNQEKLQLETARLYKEANVNPLAGCLPTLVTLPVWIGLYRALTNVANEGLLTEGWFWIPSLAGPTTIGPNGEGGGLNWLFPFENGAPPVGWHDAGAYLIMPVFLILSQYASQKILSPPQQSTDPAVQQTQAILNFLPLMIGWFSLNVPSGLTLYWFTNNVLTTAQQLYLRKFTPLSPAIQAAVAGTSVSSKPQPIRNQPDKEEEDKGPTGKDLGARRKKSRLEDEFPGGGFIDVPSTSADDSSPAAAAAPAPSASSKDSRGRKGDKFRALKAREAAAKAASTVGDAKPQEPAKTE